MLKLEIVLINGRSIQYEQVTITERNSQFIKTVEGGIAQERGLTVYSGHHADFFPYSVISVITGEGPDDMMLIKTQNMLYPKFQMSIKDVQYNMLRSYVGKSRHFDIFFRNMLKQFEDQHGENSNETLGHIHILYGYNNAMQHEIGIQFTSNVSENIYK